jgi:hypothetical protein
VVFLQGDRDVRIGWPADAAIAVREIYARDRKTNAIDNSLEFFCWDLPSYRGFDLIDKVGRFFNTGARSRANVQSKRAGVH